MANSRGRLSDNVASAEAKIFMEEARADITLRKWFAAALIAVFVALNLFAAYLMLSLEAIPKPL